ncbi:A-kinase anchor protein 13 isoform X3 [Tachysurus vachellii]|uniref:A-kinase anchor protein 13 isoform X3 n=1 Tax=Tachysurus vachellii TaxID=175792 RepID=UPI00296B203D|nr:A-kinase anchor protein 13 isoform X3 [Tachysurus vachellii]
MKLNPKQAPLYGECVLTVQLSEEECVEDEEDVEFYLLFSGSTQRHLTTTLRLGHVTLQAVCPAHDRDETVRVTLCQARTGGSVEPVGEERFQFVHDLALDMAHFLISAAAHRDGLEGALLLADSHIPVQECERLDETLMLALKHLPLPPGWSVLGPDINTHTPADFSPHETLLHFAARRGLRRVALFLLQQPGGRGALQLVNKHGHTPALVAQSRGHTQLQHLLSELEKSPHFETKAPRRRYPAGRAFLHHPRLNTFSLTVENESDGDPPDLRRDVEELRRYAHSHHHNKAGSRKQRQSFPLILSRDFVGELQSVAVTLCEGSALLKPPACEHQEVKTGEENREHAQGLNGRVRSEEGETPASGGASDSGNGTVGLEGEGVCVGKQENFAAVNTVSCGEQQQQEEVDSKLRVIREVPRTHRSDAAPETKTHNKIQSGNTQEGTMGQTQGRLPEEEKNKARGDLPEEREGERNSGQETCVPSGNTRLLHGQKHGETSSRFYLNLDVNASENVKESQVQEPGNGGDRIHESTDCTTQDQDIGEDLDSITFRPNMTPGPIHNVPLEPSPGVEQLLDTAAGDQIDATSETASDYSEQMSSDSVKDPLSCADVPVAPGQADRVAQDVPLTHEESCGDTCVDQTLLSETEVRSSPGSENNIQPVTPPEISEKTSQISTKCHYGGEEPFQEHCDFQSDARDAEITDTMDQDPESLPLFWDQFFSVPSGSVVSDSNLEESESVLKLKLETEPLSFQTPPESPCEFFSVDGFISTSGSIEATCPAGSQEIMEEGLQVETELLEMCESSKKSPVSVLCGSFSKLTIRGSPLDPHIENTTSETIERTATSAHDGDLDTSNTLSSEMEESKVEVIKLEPENVETWERSETSQLVSDVSAASFCDSASEENLGGTEHAVGLKTQIDQPPESGDVREEWMKMSTQLSENSEMLSLPCETLPVSTFVSKNITDPDSKVINFEEINNKTSKDTQTEIMTSTETVEETSLDHNLKVINFEENILEQPEIRTCEESISETSLDLHHDIFTSSENDQPPESEDVQEEWMKMSTQLGENSEMLSLPCETLPVSTFVPKNITDPDSKVINFEESNNKTSIDTQTEITTIVETSLDHNLKVINFEENILEQPEIRTFEESISETSLDLHHDISTSSGGTIEETSLVPPSEVKMSEESVQDQQPNVIILKESIRRTSLGSNHDFTSSVEMSGEVFPGPLLEVTSSKENQQLEKSRNYTHDPKHEVTAVEESTGESLEFLHDFFMPSDEAIKEMSFEALPEVKSSELVVLHQQLEVMTSDEPLRSNHDLTVTCEETLDLRSEVDTSAENVLERQPQATCDKSQNGTSEDPKGHDKPLKVTTSENSIQSPLHEVSAGKTALDQQPEITTFEESIRETQLDETTCEENLRRSPPVVLSSKMDVCLPEAPVQYETAILDPLVSCSDSDLALENISTSSSLELPHQPVDPDSVTSLDGGFAVEVDSGLTRDLSPLDIVCVNKSVTLEEEKSHTEEEHGEKPKEERVAGDVNAEDMRRHMDQTQEIHREEEEDVLYSLQSEDLTTGCSIETTETDVASVCHSVSASSLPGSESISDGDSLLGPDTNDDTVFKQSEDSLTLTSGISMTGSISTDDSSITHTVGETEEEEKKDRLTEVLERSAILRTTNRSHSPSRRHSWGPSKNQSGDTDMGQRSVVEEEVKPTGHRRSMSWCPSHVPEMEEMNSRSYSLEGLAPEDEVKMQSVQHSTHSSMTEREERGSLASLTEEENESNTGDNSSLDSQRSVHDAGCGFIPPPHTLTKSVSMSAISPRDLDELPCAAAGSLEFSILEEGPTPLRSDSEVKVTKVSRTFSYLKSKMSKKSKEKVRDKNKDGKEKEKRSLNGHLFSSSLAPPPSPCPQCNRPISIRDALTCTNCSVYVHKGCRDTVPMCAMVKMKQQSVTDSAPPPGALARGKSSSTRERPWSTFMLPEDQTSLPVPPPRKSSTIIPFNSGSLSKSISISNIAGQSDEAPLKALKILSQSTDSLNKMGKVNESTESLTDEGAELMDGHLMAEFEAEVKELEADSWSFTVDKKYLKQLKKDVIKRQDVIYELIQTEMHHLRTLRIMADVYNKGLQKEVQVEVQTLEKMFPVLEELLELHTLFFTRLLERRREAREEQRGNEGGFIIGRIGDVLLHQVTGSNAEKMKKVYGKFCSRHNEAVNIYKELHTRDKRFQAFIKKKMSSAVVRRLSIPECILLVTQRITKYPVLLQRLLQHTREPEEEQDVAEALRQVKEVLTGIDSKVNEYEKRRRLKEVYSRTDNKSIMRMKSGQMFAREDLIRGRKLLHDGPLQLKNAAGRLKDVQALLLSDVFVFLQEKDQKYVFASLDQRSTVISLQKLIVREVANEERGLFFITAGIEKPEMVEVHASTKEERNTWMQLIQNATTSIDKDEDEGIPSENEEDKRLQESKAKEMRDQLQKRDEQIVTLLEEKVRLFRELCDCTNQDEASVCNRMLFRATGDDVTKGEPIIRDALKEVEMLQELVNSSVVGQQVCVGQDDSSVCVGSVSLPRRAETFGGFDCHQMNISKNGDREEADDLRRTESDSVLKKGGTANLLLLHKRNSEQYLLSVTRLHDLLNTLQAVVVQQDTFIEEQRQALSSPSLRHPSISSSSSISSLSSCSSRPSSLMEQEKQRQEEKVREEERRRREEDDRKRREEEEERRRREAELALREERLVAMEEETQRRHEALQQEQQELSNKKEEYQRDLLRLRDDQRRLEREQLHTQLHKTEDSMEQRPRTSSNASEDLLMFLSSADSPEGVEVFSRADSKRKAKNLNLNPFSSGSGHKSGATEPHGQIPNCLLQLTKPRDKKEKKKKKGKGGQQNQTTESMGAVAPESSADRDVFFC